MTLTDVLILLAQNLALIVAVMLGLWLVALRLKDVSFVDAVWPLGMLLLALVTLPRTDGDPTRKTLLVMICAVWALRLGLHLFGRWRASGADGRYVQIVEDQERNKGWSFAKTALLFVFLPQAFLAWLTALPVQLGQGAGGEGGAAAVWCVVCGVRRGSPSPTRRRRGGSP